MNRLIPLGMAMMTTVAGCASAAPDRSPGDLQAQVMEIERAFAKTMADRDHEAFRQFLAADAIFFSGEQAIRGREAVAEAWQPYYTGPQAPFSWDPDQVQVLDSGDLALSTGPVRDPSGAVVGRFNSVWRREGSEWRVVFDKGSPVCDCGDPANP